MNCHAFIIALEDYLALHAGAAAGSPLPAALANHAADCPGCADKLQVAVQSRVLLQWLPNAADAEPDPYFYTRLRARIRAEEAAQRRPLRALSVLWRDVAVAGLLFTATLTAFVYGIHRTEFPSADAAIAVDVPLSNPYQTPERHDGRATPVDMLVSLLTP